MDELIDDDQEYNFSTQVEEELAMYIDEEMLEGAEDAEGATMCKRSADEDVCVVGDRRKGQKSPKKERRIFTVTQWDAWARKQMVRQLGQRGVT